jgi:hypothetical protein
MGDEANRYIFAVSRKDGGKLWEARSARPVAAADTLARDAPDHRYDSVYAIGQHGDFVCVSLPGEKWRKHLIKDFRVFRRLAIFGVAARRWRERHLYSGRPRIDDDAEEKTGAVAGRLYSRWRIGGLFVHHDQQRRRHGQYVTLTSKASSVSMPDRDHAV